jgi:hypothetical protein
MRSGFDATLLLFNHGYCLHFGFGGIRLPAPAWLRQRSARGLSFPSVNYLTLLDRFRNDAA